MSDDSWVRERDGSPRPRPRPRSVGPLSRSAASFLVDNSWERDGFRGSKEPLAAAGDEWVRERDGSPPRRRSSWACPIPPKNSSTLPVHGHPVGIGTHYDSGTSDYSDASEEQEDEDGSCIKWTALDAIADYYNKEDVPANHDSWVRDIDGPPVPQSLAFHPRDHDRKRVSNPPTPILEAPAVVPTEIEVVTETKQVSRFEKYGPFPFMDLPGELRNAVYPIAVEDAIRSFPPDRQKRWHTLSLLQSSSIVRSEALGIYATTQHFEVPYRCLNFWIRLVQPTFLRLLTKLDITFPPTVEGTRIFEFTEIYRLRCFTCPNVDLSIKDTDRPISNSSISSRSYVVLHAIDLHDLVQDAQAQALMACFSQPELLSDLFVNRHGEITSMKASDKLWMHYDDLKEAFGVSKDFRLTVHDLPWHGTALARTTAPRTTRKTKEVQAMKAKAAEQMKAEKKAASWLHKAAEGAGKKGGWSFFESAVGGSRAKRASKPQQPSWFSSSGHHMRGMKQVSDDEDSDPEFSESDSD
jgi:hypothetical protein